MSQVEPPKITQNYVSGLTHLNVYYSQKYNKKVYILGEKHHKWNLCSNEVKSITADHFFFQLLNSSRDYMVDVFLEDIYNPNYGDIKTRFRNESLIGMHSFLADTMNILTKSPKIKYSYRDHVRFHSVDIRNAEIPLLKYIDCIDTFWNNGCFNAIYSEQWLYNFRNVATFRSIRVAKSGNSDAAKSGNSDAAKSGNSDAAKSDNFNDQSSFENSIQEMLESTKITKQIANIPSKYAKVKSILDEELETALSKVIPKIIYSKIEPIMTQVVEEENMGALEDYIGNTIEDLTIAFAIIMDIYLISRMFRTFKDGSEAINSILYTGSLHSQMYQRVL